MAELFESPPVGAEGANLAATIFHSPDW